jgi:hypothetical protein
MQEKSSARGKSSRAEPAIHRHGSRLIAAPNVPFLDM